MPGTLFVVATPIGNLEDMTFRAVRILRESALIAAEDTRRTATLLARYDIRTPTTSFHEHNEHRKTPAILARLAAGEHVALVSDAGTPGVSDPGIRLVRGAIENAVRVEVVPGPSAAIAALVASGFAAGSFAFLGFPPARGTARRTWMAALGREPRTAVFFEAPHRIRATLAELQPQLGDRQLAVARELTKVHEEIVRGTASQVIGHLTEPRGEMTVVVAPLEAAPHQAVSLSDADILGLFRQITEEDSLNRRDVVGVIAQRTGLSPKAVYSAIERAKTIRPAS